MTVSKFVTFKCVWILIHLYKNFYVSNGKNVLKRKDFTHRYWMLSHSTFSVFSIPFFPFHYRIILSYDVTKNWSFILKYKRNGNIIQIKDNCLLDKFRKEILFEWSMSNKLNSLKRMVLLHKFQNLSGFICCFIRRIFRGLITIIWNSCVD